MTHASRSIRPHLLAALAVTFGLAGTAGAAGLGVNVQAGAGVQTTPASAQGNAQWQGSATRGAERAWQVRDEAAVPKPSAELEAELTGAPNARPAR